MCIRDSPLLLCLGILTLHTKDWSQEKTGMIILKPPVGKPTVSYTHLDVYKRQGQDIGTKIYLRGKCSVTAYDREKEVLLKKGETDVYKRQMQNIFRAFAPLM